MGSFPDGVSSPIRAATPRLPGFFLYQKHVAICVICGSSPIFPICVICGLFYLRHLRRVSHSSFTGASLATTSSAAQTRPLYEDEYGGWQRVAHDAGYEAGMERGEADARARLAFNYTRDADYLRADVGYRRDLTSIDRYRRVFRQGFEVGYEQGYRGYTDVRSERRPPDMLSDARRASSVDIAFEFGFADGYKAGVEDIRDNDRFQPTDHDAYRDADRGYERRFGDRDRFKADYRDGFHAGYTRGYREGR